MCLCVCACAWKLLKKNVYNIKTYITRKRIKIPRTFKRNKANRGEQRIRVDL